MKNVSILKCVFTLCVFSLFFQCKSEDLKIPDPAGTIQVELKIAEYGGIFVTPNGISSGFGVALDVSKSSILLCGNNHRYSFLDIGEIKGIGEITDFPDKPSFLLNWVPGIEVKQGHGYIANCISDPPTGPHTNIISSVFFCIYVEDLLKNSSGDILGAKVKYHTSFKPKHDVSTITVDKNEIIFPLSVYPTTNFLDISPLNTWTAVSSSELFTIWNVGLTAIEISPVYTTYAELEAIKGKTATITIKMDGFQDKIVPIKMADN